MADVIELNIIDDHIAKITLNDQGNKNCFSETFIGALFKLFDEINKNDNIKVVIVYGSKPFFSVGGSKNMLTTLSTTNKTFADEPFYRILLDCRVPVITACEGHALGGGLAFACYGDILVLAEESYYGCVFMDYGFTPGMGATIVTPLKFGHNLATEMLFTAETFDGLQLRQKGALVTILKQTDVFNHALKLAKNLAKKPRVSLELLKEHMTKDLRAALPGIIDAELQMHAKTFSLPEVQANITNRYGK